MATTVGTLTIEMAANIARLQKDMNSAKTTVDGAMASIKNSVDLAVKALGALGVVMGVQAFVGYIKNAINAADAMDELSQRTGLAVKDIAGLQVAFKLGGIEADNLQMAMSKLAVAAGSNSDVFKTLGVNIKNADGSIKDLRQLFGDVADAFASMEDGTLKTSKAIELFGKNGANLVPILNLGSKGLAEFDAMAAKLGLTLSAETAAAAGEFNDTLDLIGMASQGMARQIIADTLPALQGVASAFFEAVTSGEKLDAIAKIISIALKGLATVALVAIEAVSSSFKVLEFGFDSIANLLKGDFSSISAGYKKLEQDIGQSMTGTLKGLSDMWTETGNSSVSSMTKTASTLKKFTPEMTEEFKKQEAELKKNQEAYKKLMDDIDSRIGTIELQSQMTEKMTDGQKLALKVMEDLRNGTLKLNDAEKQTITQRLELLLATEQSAIAMANYRKSVDDYVKDLTKGNEELEKQIEKQNESNIEVQYGKVYVEALEVAKIRERAASIMRTAALEDEAGSDAKITEQLRLQAEGLYRLADAKEQGSFVQMAKQGADEMKRMTDELAEGMTDALMRGFENGKGFWRTFEDYIKNRMMALVAEQIIKPLFQPLAALVVDLMSPVKSAIGSLVSWAAGEIATIIGLKNAAAATNVVSGAASAVSGAATAGNAASSASSIASAAGAAGTFASGVQAGLSALVGEAGIGGALSAGATALGAGNIAGGLGTLLGAGGPIVLGAAAVYSLVKSLEGGETRAGGRYSYDPMTGARFQEGPSGGQIAGPEVISGINATVAAINAELKGIGLDLSVTKFAAGLETSNNGKGGAFASGQLSNGIKFGDYLPSMNPADWRYSKSMNAQQAYEAFTIQLGKAAVAAINDAVRGVSAFQAGGLHEGGLRLVGENGPELEATGPARYFTAGQLMGVDVAAEIKGLRDENKAQSVALVSLQARMTRLLERWDGDGLPPERVVT